MNLSKYLLLLFFWVFILTACNNSLSGDTGQKIVSVLAADSLLTDITQNIAGDRIHLQTLVPDGIDSHSFQPTPQDIARIQKSDLFIINGGGLEGWMSGIITAEIGNLNLMEASNGLEFRKPIHSETSTENHLGETGDPHFWTNPINVIKYVENIRDALIAIDPSGRIVYERNAAEYISELASLDLWIQDQVSTIPTEKRVLITNHETLGYFADRYGFEIVGTVLEGSSSESSVSSKHILELVKLIKEQQIKVAFIELLDDVSLAQQIQQETGIRIINTMNTHSLLINGITTSYVEVMKHNVDLLSELK